MQLAGTDRWASFWDQNRHAAGSRDNSNRSLQVQPSDKVFHSTACAIAYSMPYGRKLTHEVEESVLKQAEQVKSGRCRRCVCLWPCHSCFLTSFVLVKLHVLKFTFVLSLGCGKCSLRWSHWPRSDSCHISFRHISLFVKLEGQDHVRNYST